MADNNRREAARESWLHEIRRLRNFELEIVSLLIQLENAEIFRKDPARLQLLESKLQKAIAERDAMRFSSTKMETADAGATDIRLLFTSDPRTCRGGDVFRGRHR